MSLETSGDSLKETRKQWFNHFKGPDGRIRAWTFVPEKILPDILSGKLTETPSNASMDYILFKMAYAWMKDRMVESGLLGFGDEINPWWCWVRIGEGFVKPTSAFEEEGKVLLELSLSEEHLLISDFEMWHVVLNYWLNEDEETSDAFDAELKEKGINTIRIKPLPEPYHTKVEQSWRKIFDIDFVNDFTHDFETKAIQGVFWRLTPDMIVGVVEPDPAEDFE